MENEKIIVILDANVWIAEKLLQSALGSAALRAFLEHRVIIGLPEVVEREVTEVLLRHFEQSIERIQREARLIRLSSSWDGYLLLPDLASSAKFIDKRWLSLSGLLERLPLTMQHTRDALDKIIKKAPPCGENNEQFRDAAIWQSLLDLKAQRILLVSSDKGFYEGRSLNAPLAANLTKEAEEAGLAVELCSSLDAALKTLGVEASNLADDAIKTAIASLVMPRIRELAERQKMSVLQDQATVIDIIGYATPSASDLAISFKAKCNLSGVDEDDPTIETHGDVSIRGSMDWNPTAMDGDNIEVSEWVVTMGNASHSWRAGGFGQGERFIKA